MEREPAYSCRDWGAQLRIHPLQSIVLRQTPFRRADHSSHLCNGHPQYYNLYLVLLEFHCIGKTEKESEKFQCLVPFTASWDLTEHFLHIPQYCSLGRKETVLETDILEK